jgi:leucyl-tRNA synthetase
VRARVTLAADASEDEIRAAALAAPAIQALLAGMAIVKIVVANRRLVNVVVRQQKG